MSQLIVRNIEESLVRELKKRAGEHGISMEEEHRQILREALAREVGGKGRTFWEALTEMPLAGDEELFERDRSRPGRASEQSLEEESRPDASSAR
jgi:plasmid stability protein